MGKKKKSSKKADRLNSEVIKKETGISFPGSQVRIDLHFSNDVSLSMDDLS